MLRHTRTSILKHSPHDALRPHLFLVKQALSDELARVQALPADAPPTEEEARHLASLLAEIRNHDSLTKAAAVSAATERCDSVRLLTA